MPGIFSNKSAEERYSYMSALAIVECFTDYQFIDSGDIGDKPIVDQVIEIFDKLGRDFAYDNSGDQKKYRFGENHRAHVREKMKVLMPNLPKVQEEIDNLSKDIKVKHPDMSDLEKIELFNVQTRTKVEKMVTLQEVGEFNKNFATQVKPAFVEPERTTTKGIIQGSLNRIVQHFTRT
jgi:hypothetical protein